MNFDYNEEQQLLADAVARWAQKDYGFERRRAIIESDAGWSSEAWRTLADMGLLGLALAPEYGGYGGGAGDLFAVMEAFGEALVVEPFLAGVGLGARLVARAGSAAQKEALLPPFARGERLLAFAQTEARGRYDFAHPRTRATRTDGGWRLDGEKRVVLGAPCADTLIVSAASAAGPSLFLVERAAPGVALRAYRTLDGQRAADVALRDVRLPAGALLGRDGEALDAIEEAIDFATALACAEAVGAMKYANEATLAFLKTRKQFGVPIGSFQALQHRIVDMHIAAEQARSMACLAASKVDAAADARERMRIVSAAKIRVADACRQVSQESVQLHGGMGMSDELKVSHTFRRLTTIAQQFGDADHHLARFAALG